ncbi:Protein OCTOPUS [Linum perenne]
MQKWRQKWRQKQKLKKERGNRGGGGSVSGTLPVEKPIGRQYRETQSEIADYGFGRRSCDTDPRFSLDIGRMSFDDPRYSFDEPRASWNGYLMGRTFPTRMPTMLSIVEDAPVVMRSDAHIPVEEPIPPPPPPPLPAVASLISAVNSVTEDEFVPGGCAQTRGYYTDSSSRRRKSLDRYSSRGNGVERSFSESWPDLRGERNGNNGRVGFNPNLMRSNSSVSWRNSNGFGGGIGSFGSGRKSNVETCSSGNGFGGRKN